MLLDHMVHFQPVICEPLLAVVAHTALPQTQVRSGDMQLSVQFSRESLVASFALVDTVAVPPKVADFQHLPNESGTTFLADVVPKMRVHVLVELLETLILDGADRAFEKVARELVRDYLVLNSYIHFLLVARLQVGHQVFQIFHWFMAQCAF